MDVDLPDVNIGRDPNELYVTLQADVTQPTGLQILPDHVKELGGYQRLIFIYFFLTINTVINVNMAYIVLQIHKKHWTN